MSLKVYMGDLMVPEGVQIVRDNRDFFMRNTIELLDTRMNGVLTRTGGACYLDDLYFTDRFGAKVSLSDMSTGGMTVLNVLYNPDVCFHLLESGENAVLDLLTGCTEGHVAGFRVWNYVGEDVSCDVLLNGYVVYNTVKELME